MQIPAEFAPRVDRDIALGPMTAYGVGGTARWLARPASVEELIALVELCRISAVPIYPLGKGANLLVSDDGVDGLVLRLDAAAFQDIDWPSRNERIAHGSAIVRAGAGADMHRLVRESVRRGLGGLEVLAGIPGSLGGIVRMNAGGRWGQIADVVRRVTVVEPGRGLRVLEPAEVGFAYRRTELGEAIVCGVELALTWDDPQALRERMLAIWSAKKAAQPFAEHSAGCVFKNPPRAEMNGAVPESARERSASAGALIDRAGLKGLRVGGASVSTQHGNFIVAEPSATAADIMTLIGRVRRAVAERFGVELELEIKVWDRVGSGQRERTAC